jgi:hypothetical protein
MKIKVIDTFLLGDRPRYLGGDCEFKYLSLKFPNYGLKNLSKHNASNVYYGLSFVLKFINCEKSYTLEERLEWFKEHPRRK